MRTQKDELFRRILLDKNIFDEFHRAFRKIIVCGIGTRRISPRVSILGSHFPTATAFIFRLFDRLVILGIPVIIQLRDRIALVIRLSAAFRNRFHGLVRAQEFRSTKDKVFLELCESGANFFGLLFTVVRERPALACIVTAFCMA